MSTLTVLWTLALLLGTCQSFYFNTDSFTDHYNKEFQRQHPTASKQFQSMYPKSENGNIFVLQKVSLAYFGDFVGRFNPRLLG